MKSNREFIQDFRDSLSDLIDKDLTAPYIQMKTPFGYCPLCKKPIYNQRLHCRRCKGKLIIDTSLTNDTN